MGPTELDVTEETVACESTLPEGGPGSGDGDCDVARWENEGGVPTE